jgi:CHAT domain-containing protein/Tfp pilus assembly protein PilF
MMIAGCRHDPELPLSKLYADAYSQLQSGDLEAALQLADRGSRQSQSTDSIWNYKFRVLKAEVLVGQGKASDSLNALEPDPPPQLATGEFSVRRRIAQSRAFCRLRQFPEAELRIADAENMATAGSPDSLGDVALNRGACLHVRNQEKQAQIYFVEALNFARQHKQPFLEANAVGSLGSISVQAQRFDEAIDRFKDALTLARALGARRTEEKTLGYIGKSFFELGDFPNASSYTKQAEALASSLGNIDDQQSWLTILGDQYLAQKNYDAAASAYSHALQLIVSLNNKDDTPVANCFHNLAEVELGRHNLSKAEDYNQRVAAMGGNKKESPLYISHLLATAQIAAAKGLFSEAEAPLKEAASSPDADLSDRWQAQTDLADLYVSWGKTAKADQAFQEAIRIMESARILITHEEQRMSILDAAPFFDGYVRFLVDHGEAMHALQLAEYSRSRTLSEGLGLNPPTAKLNFQQIQLTLRRHNEVVLAYWIAEKQSYLWVMAGGQPMLFRLPQKADIDQAVKDYSSQVLARRKLEDSPSGGTLYDMLVKPAASLIPQDSHVVIIPHGSLYRLNFETLIVPGAAPHYWIDDVVIENSSSLLFRFGMQRRTARTPKELLLMGDPVQATPEYPKLKHAAEEMKAVSTHFSPAMETLIADKEAVPAAYFQARPEDYRFIDFVTHGTAVQLVPLDSAIVLSPDKDNAYKLYAHDIIKRPIHSEVVTISACYGVGQRNYSGEGLVGLAWAFMRAGAQQVVAALWEAEDSVTPTLMNDFYGEIKRGKNASDALHTAKVKMLHSSELSNRPYYWASLQLYTGS